MPAKKLSPGILHPIPADLKKALLSSEKAYEMWEEVITPIARNEWICWTTSFKKQETRDDHVRQVVDRLSSGKKRPCCWPGCSHRK